jgi:hypothetical protein
MIHAELIFTYTGMSHTSLTAMYDLAVLHSDFRFWDPCRTVQQDREGALQ